MTDSIEVLVNNLVLRGMVKHPSETKNPQTPNPTAILFHGFGGHRYGPRGLLANVAEGLVNTGFTVFAFDFLGCGESDGGHESVTVSSKIEQANAIVDFVRNLPFVDPTAVSLLGYSVGATVASVVAGERPKDIHKLVLLSPAGNVQHMPLYKPATRYFSVNRHQEVFELAGLQIGRPFTEDYPTHDFYTRAKGFQGPVLLLHGSGDKECPPIASEIYVENCYAKSGRLKLIDGGDHLYTGWETLVKEQVVEFMTDK